MKELKMSIFTPTHKDTYLGELYETIKLQTYSNWEWIILVNNGLTITEPKELLLDKRIIFKQSNSTSKNVGALKKEACSYATGDILVEVDHDDLLTTNCLEKLNEAFQDDEIGFAYSDNAKLSDNFIPYNKDYGWTYKKFVYNNKELIAMNSQPEYPGRIGYIWFAPDHVRAWRKTVYDSIGGHNPELSICDDQELIIKTYLVSKFKYIPEVLYIYRITGDNTWIERNALIQKTTVEIYNKYIYQLAERYTELNSLLKIDLCGGFNKPKGYVSIDKFNGDIIADLEQGIPLPDNSVGVIRAHDALEHIADKIGIMKEIHRVLAKGGMLLSMTPSTDGRGAFQDPTHISFYNQNSFWYYTRLDQSKYIGMQPLFRECALFTYFPNKYCEENNISYVKADLEVQK